MKQLISKRWGLTPGGKPVRLPRYAADSPDEALPEGLPIGSDCLCADGSVRVYFGGETGWVTLKTGASGDQASAAVDDETISETTAWSSSKVSTLLGGKADADGVYPLLCAGTATALAGGAASVRRIGFDASGGKCSIGTGGAKLHAVCGCTLLFRQILNHSAAGTETSDGVTFTRIGGGPVEVVTGVNGATADAAATVGSYHTIRGHKYLLKGCPEGGSAQTWRLGSADVGNGAIFTAAQSTGANLKIRVSEGTRIPAALTFYPQIFDLTEMFGEGNEPASPAEFSAMFPGFYAYGSAPVTLNFKGTSLRSVGFNAFDGEKARVVKGRDGAGENHGYELHGTYTTVEFAYTENGRRVTLTPQTYLTERGDTVTRVLPPDNGWLFLGGAGADACVHLIWSGNKSGDSYVYESYAESVVSLPTAELFPDGMSSCRGVYDEITPLRAVRRIGRADLGTLNWKPANASLETNNLFYCTGLSGAVAPASSTAEAGILETDFMQTRPHAGVYAQQTPGISLSATGSLWIYTTDYTNAADLKAAMNGRELRYALASPVVTDFSQRLNFDFRVSDMGTEEILSGVLTAPGKLMTEYALNVQDVIARLDTDYISKKSFDNFAAALYGATGILVSCVSSDGQYLFTVDCGSRILPSPRPEDAGKTVVVDANGAGYVLRGEE